MASIRNYLMMSMLGYFGIKIVNSAFKAVPPKTSSNEMWDFGTAMVMGGILYFMNNMDKRELMGADKIGTWLYYFGFAAGLTVPFVKHNMLDNMRDDIWDRMQYFLYVIVGSIILITLYITASTQQNDIVKTSNYLLYVLTIVLLMIGIIFTKRGPERYPTTTKDSDEKAFYETAGQYTNLGLAIMSWLISLLFVADSDNGTLNSFIAFMQGIFYGIFIGSTSLYGAKYLLSNTVDHSCVGRECRIQGMIIDDAPIKNLTAQVNTNRWVLALTIIVLMVMISLFYATTAEFLPFGN